MILIPHFTLKFLVKSNALEEYWLNKWTSTASRPSWKVFLGLSHTPGTLLRAAWEETLQAGWDWKQLGLLGAKIKQQPLYHSTGHCRVATCPSQFTSAAARWQQPLLFLCFALHRVHNLHRPAHPTCLSFPLYPPPFSSGGNKGVESCADATGVLGIFVHQLLLMLARSQPTGRSDCEPATGNPVPRSRGHLPRPEGCHYWIKCSQLGTHWLEVDLSLSHKHLARIIRKMLL